MARVQLVVLDEGRDPFLNVCRQNHYSWRVASWSFALRDRDAML